MLLPRIHSLPPNAGSQLFVTDLDGTLLDNSARVPVQSAALISELSHCGALISIATARTPATVDPLMAHVFTTPPAIVLTGAAMWSRRHRKYINPVYIDPAAGALAVNVCREAGVQPFAYTLHEPTSTLHVYRNGPLTNREAKFINDRSELSLKRFHLDTPAGEGAVFDSLMLVFAMGPAPLIHTIARALRTDTRLSVSAYTDTYNPGTGIIEVFGAGVSKAAAVLRLKEMTGASGLTVFGDNLNDLSMMAVADTAVAVANAADAVLEAADTVIGPNTENSVAEYILSVLTNS